MGTVVAVLADSQIRDEIRIEPFEEARKRQGKVSYGVSSYGYDVRVGSHFKIFTPTPRHGGIAVVDPKNFSDDLFVEVDCAKLGTDHVVIPPNSFALCETVEYIAVPRNVLVICVGKSTYARCGIILNVTPLEPEWRGKVTLEIRLEGQPLPGREGRAAPFRAPFRARFRALDQSGGGRGVHQISQDPQRGRV